LSPAFLLDAGIQVCVAVMNHPSNLHKQCMPASAQSERYVQVYHGPFGGIGQQDTVLGTGFTFRRLPGRSHTQSYSAALTGIRAVRPFVHPFTHPSTRTSLIRPSTY
jgi:hypothetical protein